MIKTELFKSHFIPSTSGAKKLMLVLHGKGDSLRPFKQFNEELGLNDFNFLLLNAPKKFLGGYSWYGDPPYQKAGVLKIRSKLLQLMDELTAQGWKSEDIFLFGFSQGCLMSADLALNYPKKLGGVIGISGYFQFYPRWRSSLSGNRQTPWLLTHGHKDDVLPLKTTKFGMRKLSQAGVNVEWVELNKKHDLIEEEYKIIRKWVRQQL